ncbi:MAG TPA: TerB N-terminal domain-containing protein [Thermoanaerobaculia bacterium]|nr:TerB N-terminal domain-containing protein [Thermoanaerobaculia bacterium]
MKIAPEALRWAERAIARLREGLFAGTVGTRPPGRPLQAPTLAAPLPAEHRPAPPPASMVAVAGAAGRIEISFQPQPAPVPRATYSPAARAVGLRTDAGNFWQPREWSGQVGGLQLREGMLYVGSGLAGLSRWRAPIEPALIDPSLPVACERPDHFGQLMTYWPSYSNIPASCRAAYLTWLAGGRSDPTAGIGYVFLFFYGLERRVLVDAFQSPLAKQETASLLDELRRLLRLYGGNRSFRGYAMSFLRAAKLLHEGVDPETLAPPPEPSAGAGWLDLKIGLGAFAASGAPVAAEWALAWLTSLPEVNHRRAAQRCSDDFARLFLLRYRDAFGSGGGIKLRQRRTRLTAHYSAASPSFEGPIRLPLPDLPDIDLTAPPTRLCELGNRVLDELAPYSRWIGRTGDTESPAALALLPADLMASHESPLVRSFMNWIDTMIDGPARGVVGLAELADHWPARTAGRFRRADAEVLASFLATRGYGVEPDARVTSFSPAKVRHLAFFRSPQAADAAVNETPSQAEALLLLAATVHDGTTPLTVRCGRQLGSCLAERWALTSAQLARLEARRLRLVSSPPSLIEAKRRIQGLGEREKADLAGALIHLATAYGQVESADLPQLSNIYRLLGLPSRQLYSDLHAVLCAGKVDAGPITVIEGERASAGYTLPPQAAHRGAPALDDARIRETLTETDQLQGLLASIFNETAGDSGPIALAARKDDYSLLGLDASHSALLHFLSSRATWKKQQVERLTRALGLLPDGALEVINEAAFAAFGEAALEGDDPVEVRTDLIGDKRHG